MSPKIPYSWSRNRYFWIEDFHTSIHVSDLPIAKNKNIEVLTEGDKVVASVSAPRGTSTDDEEGKEVAEGEKKEEEKEEKAE